MPGQSRRGAVFLDRDGVINVDHNYVHRVADFVFVDGIFALCRAAQASGYLLVVVTNQAGIGRGFYSEDDFHRLTAWMVGVFASEQVSIAAVYFCPFHPTEGVGEYCRESPDRKPNPGMLFRARDELGLDLTASVLIGDKLSDIEAGRRAGVGRLCLVDLEGRTTPGVVGKDAELFRSLQDVRRALFPLIPVEREDTDS